MPEFSGRFFLVLLGANLSMLICIRSVASVLLLQIHISDFPNPFLLMSSGDYSNWKLNLVAAGWSVDEILNQWLEGGKIFKCL